MDEIPYRAKEAVTKILTEYNPETLLDVGCGDGKHAEVFRENGIDVTTLDADPVHKPDIRAYFTQYFPLRKYDVVWASHVMEHQLNVGMFLDKLSQCATIGGLLAVTVPPFKHDIVGGHYTVWNAGLLLYNFVMAGFDCSEARVCKYGYNISILVENCHKPLPEGLKYDRGDIELLADRFPMEVHQGFDGDFERVNWERR